MQSLFMLDTNIASYAIKGNFPAVRKQLLIVPMAQVCISAVTEAELLYGVAQKPNAKDLKTIINEFLLRVDILPWDSEAARQYALLRSQLERIGKPLGNLDMLIAAHALATKAILVTSDKAFKHIAQLNIVNWAQPKN